MSKTNFWLETIAPWFVGVVAGFVAMKMSGVEWTFTLFGALGWIVFKIFDKLIRLDQKIDTKQDISISTLASKSDEEPPKDFRAAKITYVIDLNSRELIQWHFPNDADAILKSYTSFMNENYPSHEDRNSVRQKLYTPWLLKQPKTLLTEYLDFTTGLILKFDSKKGRLIERDEVVVTLLDQEWYEPNKKNFADLSESNKRVNPFASDLKIFLNPHRLSYYSESPEPVPNDILEVNIPGAYLSRFFMEVRARLEIRKPFATFPKRLQVLLDEHELRYNPFYLSLYQGKNEDPKELYNMDENILTEIKNAGLDGLTFFKKNFDYCFKHRFYILQIYVELYEGIDEKPWQTKTVWIPEPSKHLRKYGNGKN